MREVNHGRLVRRKILMDVWCSTLRLVAYGLEVAGLERGPLSLVSTTEKLLERKSSGSGLENRNYGRRNPSR
jgi:hypothetical protein